MKKGIFSVVFFLLVHLAIAHPVGSSIALPVSNPKLQKQLSQISEAYDDILKIRYFIGLEKQSVDNITDFNELIKFVNEHESNFNFIPAKHVLEIFSLKDLSAVKFNNVSSTSSKSSQKISKSLSADFEGFIGNTYQKIKSLHLTPLYYESIENTFNYYSSSFEVEEMIKGLEDNLTKICSMNSCYGKRSEGSRGRCWRYVKWGLMEGGYSDNYPGIRYARNAGFELESLGFHNLLKEKDYRKMTSVEAPVGAILVYKGGRRRFGHIEVKASNDKYLSDFSSEKPIDRTDGRHRLIGIYVKAQKDMNPFTKDVAQN
ncbi:hypothetical protein ACG2LH_13880 [Zhouia sp. PK063]|uniref:hypothetical protein n=1 Tax=Zhouia sp. PK063 TaxID=3373602 RepID=UPI003794ABFF